MTNYNLYTCSLHCLKLLVYYCQIFSCIAKKFYELKNYKKINNNYYYNNTRNIYNNTRNVYMSYSFSNSSSSSESLIKKSMSMSNR